MALVTPFTVHDYKCSRKILARPWLVLPFIDSLDDNKTVDIKEKAKQVSEALNRDDIEKLMWKCSKTVWKKKWLMMDELLIPFQPFFCRPAAVIIATLFTLNDPYTFD